jgi:anaerobic magnesium-protoporphyrin IX monomethyl ester cyclase
MKILLVWTDIGSDYTSYASFHFGVASIATVLQQQGHEIATFCPTLPKEAAEYAEYLASLDPDLLAFSVMTVQWPFDSEMIAEFKKLRPEVPVVVGGYHPSLAPEEVLSHPDVDYVIRGEGELVLSELVASLEGGDDPRGILGVWSKHNGEAVRNPLAQHIVDLDVLPDVNFDLFDIDAILRGRAGAYPMMAGRGCPFSCTYCCNPAWRCIHEGQGYTTRFRSVERVVCEMERAVSQWPQVRYFEMADEVFTMRRGWLEPFLAEYERRVGLPMSVMLRADSVDYELLKKMRRAGIFQLRFGIEHGDEQFRRQVLNRKMSNDKLIEVFDMAHDLGFETFGYVMVGLPHETPELADRTVELIRRINLCDSQISIYYPFPMTRLYDECINEGWYDGERPSSYFDRSALRMPQFPPEEIKRYQRKLQEVVVEQQIRKRRYGYYDFLLRLNEAEIDAPPSFVGHAFFFFKYPKTSHWLMAHPPARLSYRVPITDPAFLNFSICMHPDVYQQPGGGVRFIVRVDGHLIFEEAIDAKANPEKRGWKDVSIDVSSYAGEQRTIELITDAVLDPDNSYCTAGWGRPHLAPEPNARGPAEATFVSTQIELADQAFVA